MDKSVQNWGHKMKTVLVVIILIAAFVVGGYFGLPIIIEKETSGLKSEIHDLKRKMQKIEEFIKREEEIKKTGKLSSDADVQKIIRTVNAIFSKVASLEDSYKEEMSLIHESIKKQGTSTEEALKKQSEIIDKSNKENQSKIQKIRFDAAMASIRGNLLKVQVDLKSKNIWTAKTELDLINEIFEKTKASVSNEEKQDIEELQAALKKAKGEVEINLPAALDRIDLLWHEMGKLIMRGS